VGGMSGDHDRCFSILVLGAFSTVVFNTNVRGVLVGRVYGRRSCFVSARTIKGIIIITPH
jgi:hypothetical protein